MDFYINVLLVILNNIIYKLKSSKNCSLNNFKL